MRARNSIRIGCAGTIVSAVITSAGAFAQDKAEISELFGLWKIDLRPTPEADAYFQEMVIKRSQNGKDLIGTFYGSPIERPLYNTSWDRVYFAFSTRDQNHQYYHSGYVEDGQVHGMTYCPGREFAAPWTGKKK